MCTNEADREMITEITQMGMRAAILLKGVMIKKVDRGTLEWGLEEINASSLMSKYSARITNNPEYVQLFNLLALVSSLEDQLDYQIQEYGIDSLKDDLEEINTSLRSVGLQFDPNQLQTDTETISSCHSKCK
jgi:hypothetical protein